LGGRSQGAFVVVQASYVGCVAQNNWGFSDERHLSTGISDGEIIFAKRAQNFIGSAGFCVWQGKTVTTFSRSATETK
jgi:hypothetical protein